MAIGSSSTVVGNGALFLLKIKNYNADGDLEIQKSDFIRLHGQSSTTTRNYGSPITVVGPSRILAYVTPSTNTSTVYCFSMDFFEP